MTPVGCGIAGFEPVDIAPLFEAAKEIENTALLVADGRGVDD